MIFKGIENQIVEFKITNYQYPDNDGGDWDGNWLNIYLNVKSNVGHWQTVDPSLTTWEVLHLINWFKYLSSTEQTESSEIEFTEPNLSFELINSRNKEQKRFRIKFNLESRPKFATNDKEYFVECIADNKELERIAKELKIELDKFPERRITKDNKLQKGKHSWWQKLFGF